MDQNSQNGVTSISQLPTSNQIASSVEQFPQTTNIAMNTNPNSNNNIMLTKNEVIGEATSQMQNPMMQIQQGQQNLEQNVQQGQSGQNNYNELINQLQQASSSGATSLPSRDIPSNPIAVANDIEVKPNFIPQASSNEDYINNMQTPENLMMQNNKAQNQIDTLDAFYNEFQLPILIAILYFLFQLPIFRRGVKKMAPVLFGQDGNPNLYGYFFNSGLFAIIFYILIKAVNHITSSF